jgi:methyl-accepting chemotaxis protein
LISGSVEKIDIGCEQATRSGSVLAEIVGSVKKVSDLNGEIAAASSEQSNGITQIGKAMNQMDQVTQKNAAASEESAAAAEELSAQSAALRENVVVLNRVVQGK